MTRERDVRHETNGTQFEWRMKRRIANRWRTNRDVLLKLYAMGQIIQRQTNTNTLAEEVQSLCSSRTPLHGKGYIVVLVSNTEIERCYVCVVE